MEIKHFVKISLKDGEEYFISTYFPYVEIIEYPHLDEISFSISFPRVYKKFAFQDEVTFEETEMTVFIYFHKNRIYFSPEGRNQKCYPEEKHKLVEYLLHRDDVLQACEELEDKYLYDRLKMKPKVAGYTEMAEMYDETTGDMVDIRAYIDKDF